MLQGSYAVWKVWKKSGIFKNEFQSEKSLENQYFSLRLNKNVWKKSGIKKKKEKIFLAKKKKVSVSFYNDSG